MPEAAQAEWPKAPTPVAAPEAPPSAGALVGAAAPTIRRCAACGSSGGAYGKLCPACADLTGRIGRIPVTDVVHGVFSLTRSRTARGWAPSSRRSVYPSAHRRRRAAGPAAAAPSVSPRSRNVAPPWPAGASTFGDPAAAPLPGHYHGIDAGTPTPAGIHVMRDDGSVGGPHARTHHTIYPFVAMTFSSFVGTFLGFPWKRKGKK